MYLPQLNFGSIERIRKERERKKLQFGNRLHSYIHSYIRVHTYIPSGYLKLAHDPGGRLIAYYSCMLNGLEERINPFKGLRNQIKKYPSFKSIVALQPLGEGGKNKLREREKERDRAVREEREENSVGFLLLLEEELRNPLSSPARPPWPDPLLSQLYLCMPFSRRSLNGFKQVIIDHS